VGVGQAKALHGAAIWQDAIVKCFQGHCVDLLKRQPAREYGGGPV
jgi:hypothetical protein